MTMPYKVVTELWGGMSVKYCLKKKKKETNKFKTVSFPASYAETFPLTYLSSLFSSN